MRKRRSSKRRALIAASLALCLLSGCGRSIPSMSDTKAENGYTKQEAMIIVSTERNQHEAVYTDAIWAQKVNGTQETYQDFLIGQIKSFLEDMKVMRLLALDRQITLTAEEKAAMEDAAKEYYAGLTKEDIEVMNVTEEDASVMYQDYFLANKLVNELTKDVDLEVSDSEAKVISIMEIKTDTKEAAEEAYRKATAEGADFAAVAEGYPSDGKISRFLGRGEESKSFEDAAFSLAPTEVSQVISDDEGFYVLYCVSDYDEEETRIRKEQIYGARKQQAFRQIYDSFKAQTTLSYTTDYWGELDFKDKASAAQVDFFEIYRKHTQS